MRPELFHHWNLGRRERGSDVVTSAVSPLWWGLHPADTNLNRDTTTFQVIQPFSLPGGYNDQVSGKIHWHITNQGLLRALDNYDFTTLKLE